MKIDFGVDIIYIINLKKHKTRKNNIVKLLEKYEITNYEFIEAEEGFHLPPTQELMSKGILNDYFVDPNGMITKNIIACAMSHRMAYEAFLKTNYKTCLILEDDVKFSNRIFEYILDGRFKQIKRDIIKHDIGIFHWGKQQLDKITGARDIEGSPMKIFPRNNSPQSAQAYQLNRWTAQYLFDNCYPIKMAADVYLDAAKVKINCPEHSLIIQHNGPIREEYLEGLTEALWTKYSNKEYESSTTDELHGGQKTCFISGKLDVDRVSFRNYKTDDGAVLRRQPIIYFKK
tara:strand:+ start:23 stop:886 length:864 start_codon:yes stop_codon:yes gene_type:complete